VVVVLLAAAGYLVHTRAPRSADTAQFGRVRIYPSWLTQKGFIYLFSGAHGWSEAEEETARDFARDGQLVIGIDTPQFTLWAARRPLAECLYMPGLLEDYSRVLQRATDNAQYLAPALLGAGPGATLVYMAQLQAPPVAFSAAVMIDPQEQIAVARPFCDHPENHSGEHEGEQATLRPEKLGTEVPARLLLDASATAGEREFAMAIPGAVPTTLAASATAVVDGATLHDIYRSALDAIAVERSQNGVGDLPLAIVESSATQRGALPGSGAGPERNAFAIIYSGDGGWRDLDRSLAGILASKGMNVVGVDVLRYYWKQKSPTLAASDLARIMRYYQQRWHQQKVVLIGFSFGADVLPFLVSRLPADLAADVSLVSLLSPERSTAFEVETTGWLGVHNSSGMPIAPELQKLSKFHLQCIYGTDEGANSLCTTPTAAAVGASVLAKSGGHHFDQDYGTLADQILAAVP
jgi:type IV secretory pathway VirJ component